MAGAHDSTQGRILLGCYKADWNSDISGEHDRFWIFTPQPEINLLAAAHDSGCCNTGHLGLADFTAAVHGMQILLNAWRLNWEVMFLLCLPENQCLIWGLQVLFSVAEIGFIEGHERYIWGWWADMFRKKRMKKLLNFLIQKNTEWRYQCGVGGWRNAWRQLRGRMGPWGSSSPTRLILQAQLVTRPCPYIGIYGPKSWSTLTGNLV